MQRTKAEFERKNHLLPFYVIIFEFKNMLIFAHILNIELEKYILKNVAKIGLLTNFTPSAKIYYTTQRDSESFIGQLADMNQCTVFTRQQHKLKSELNEKERDFRRNVKKQTSKELKGQKK